MVGAIERAPREFQSLRLSQKCLCVVEMVGTYLWPLFGIVAALVMWRRGNAYIWRFCAVAGAVASMAVYAVELTRVLLAG